MSVPMAIGIVEAGLHSVTRLRQVQADSFLEYVNNQFYSTLLCTEYLVGLLTLIISE